MPDYMTRDWAVRFCKRYFHLSDADEWLVKGPTGKDALMALWQENPGAYYESPLQLLRQEWFHAVRDAYPHLGFWAALPKGALVLDYGCGTAEVARLPWITRGGAIVLVDASPQCLGYLEEKYDAYSLAHIRSGVGAWESLGPFDALICTDVFEHIPNPLDMQVKLWSLLKPGGHALLKFENAYPHPGHLADAIAQIPAWWDWVKCETQPIEMETYLWAMKP